MTFFAREKAGDQPIMWLLRLRRPAQLRKPAPWDELVHFDDEFWEGFPALGVFHEGDGDVAFAVGFDEGGVAVGVFPGAGFAVDFAVAGEAFEAFDELVVDAGVGHEALHFGGVLGGDEFAAVEHEEEAGDLEGGGAVGEVVEGVALPVVVGAAVGFADPKAAVD